MNPHSFRRRMLITAILAAFPLIASCGGGGGGPEPLFGELNVTDFILPAGQTRKVTQDLTIRSTGNIQIDGNLIVVPGALVNLLADRDLLLNGRITGEPVRKNAVTRQDSDAPGFLFVGANITTATQFQLELEDPSVSLIVVNNDPDGQVTVAGNITTRDGTDSTARGTGGGRSGSIEIGSNQALILARGKGVLNAVAPRTVTIQGVLRTGRGGNGFTDLQGVDEGRVLRATASDGGRAGGIRIAASERVDFSAGAFRPGNGGRGGDVGSAQSPVRGRNGTQVLEMGQSIIAAPGSGGFTGEAEITPGPTPELPDRPVGGRAGSVYVAAGNGGPAGRGGDVTTGSALPGQPQIVQPVEYLTSVYVSGGGNGGDAAGPQGLESLGGTGGNVTVNRFTTRVFIHVANAGNAGNGWNGCASSPVTSGGEGGEGGRLFGEPTPERADVDVAGSFEGGDGGAGNPPGAAGKGGWDVLGNTYPDGQPGGPCDTQTGSFSAPTHNPLVTGSQYAYQETQTGSSPINTVEVVGTQANFTGIGNQLFPVDTMIGGYLRRRTYTTSDTTNGVQYFQVDQYNSTGTAVTFSQNYNPPDRIPHNSLIGQPFSQSISRRTQVGTTPPTTQVYQHRNELMAFESVTVPAGTFPNSAKVHFEIRLGTSLVSSYDCWFAPNVGLIKLDSSGFNKVLTSYNIP